MLKLEIFSKVLIFTKVKLRPIDCIESTLCVWQSAFWEMRFQLAIVSLEVFDPNASSSKKLE